ncbi:MAG: BspA family leucine-rich repeat surface protein [Prevotella sp.]
MKRKLNQSILMAIVMTMLFPLAAAAEAVGYAVFNSADNTLTFKFGEKPVAGADSETVYDLNEGGNLPEWTNSNNTLITKVVFDESFKEARPTTCAYWFYWCENLTNIEGIENLNTSEVTNMTSMFFACTNLFYLDLTNFDTRKVTIMPRMFYGCQNLTSIYVSENFVVDNLNDGGYMFTECTSLIGAVKFNAVNTDQTYANYNNGYFTKPYPAVGEGVAYAISNSTYETLIFKYGETLPDGAKDIDINSGNSFGWGGGHADVKRIVFDPSFKNVRPTTCQNLFAGLYNLTDIIGIENLNTSEVTDMRYMFNGARSLTSLDLSNFDTSKVTDMSLMFNECSWLTSIDLSNFDTSNVTDMCAMFFECFALTSLDLSSFNTSNVTNMSLMFYNCHTLTSLDLSNFDTSNVRDISWMFEECSALTSLNISNFNTEKVTDMSGMFSSCSSLTSLDLSSFNTEKVTGMSGMFSGCQELTTIYVSDKFTTDNVNNSNNMFTGCSSLIGAAQCDGSTSVDGTGANYLDGYFKTYYKVDGTQTDLYGNGNYDTNNKAYEISTPLSFTDGDIVTNVPLNVVNGGISYTRTMASEWGTLCLPFDVTYTSNESYKLYRLTSATADALTFTEWEYGSEILAGTPMAIKRISDTGDNSVTISPTRVFIKTSLNNPESDDAWRLVGTYRTADVPDEGYVISQNAFWNVKGLKDEGQNIKRVRVNGYRAYIMPPTAESEASVGLARMFSIAVPDDNTTAIDDINAVFGGEATYYDTNGRRIPSLRQGVNIVKIGNRTKKVIIK